jgi:hypothetical protein
MTLYSEKVALLAELHNAKARLAECEAECLEQARCNGMGSEREARLMARLAEAENVIRRIVDGDEIKTPWQIAHEYLRAADSAEDWQCSCGKRHPDNFDRCPSCGGLRTWTAVTVTGSRDGNV